MKRASRVRSQEGLAAFVLPLVLWCTVIVAVVVVDLAGYLVAGARAQSLADAAALAAVAADARDPLAALAAPGTIRQPVVPEAEARRVVDAGGGALEHCTCPMGHGTADVRVSMPVHGLVAPAVVARRVEATATATLVPP